jgi:hypothetical protein
LYRVYVRLKKIAVLRGLNGSVNFDIISKSRYSEWELHHICPGQIPEGHRRELQMAWKEYQKRGPEISGWIGNCETSLHSHQKAQKH